MKGNTFWLIAMGIIAGPMQAHAVLIDYGTAELVTARYCNPGATTACDGISWPVDLAYGGLPGATISSATVSAAGLGSAAGSVSLSGTIGAPILHASASSAQGGRMNTNSIALQRYTYNGTATDTRTFGGTLTYSQALTGTYPFDVGNGVNAAIDVFKLADSTVDVGETAASNFLTLFGGFSTLPGFLDLGFAQYQDGITNAGGVGTFGVTVTLNPGDSIWVWALLQTPATNGSTVDASHTLVTGWSNSADLAPAVAVPEPDTLALLGVGLAGLAGARRRRY